MLNKSLILASCLLLPVSLSAQAGPVSEKSAAEITCELSGDCDAFSQELATLDATDDRAFSLRLLSGMSGANGKSASNGARAPGRYASAADVSSAGSKKPRIRTIPPRKPIGVSQPGLSALAIGFTSGSDAFTDGGLSQARKLLESIKPQTATGKRFLVAGHTDSVGSRELNLELSRRRANALVKFLVDNGIDPARLDAKGLGMEQPLSGLSPRNGANRRVEIAAIN